MPLHPFSTLLRSNRQWLALGGAIVLHATVVAGLIGTYTQEPLTPASPLPVLSVGLIAPPQPQADVPLPHKAAVTPAVRPQITRSATHTIRQDKPVLIAARSESPTTEQLAEPPRTERVEHAADAVTTVNPVPATASPSVSATQAVAAAPSPSAAPKTVSLSALRYIREPQAERPAVSRQLGEGGLVVVKVLVDEQGVPRDAQIQKSSGFRRLDAEARRAALGALFHPYSEAGRTSAVFAVIPFSFES